MQASQNIVKTRPVRDYDSVRDDKKRDKKGKGEFVHRAKKKSKRSFGNWVY